MAFFGEEEKSTIMGAKKSKRLLLSSEHSFLTFSKGGIIIVIYKKRGGEDDRGSRHELDIIDVKAPAWHRNRYGIFGVWNFSPTLVFYSLVREKGLRVKVSLRIETPAEATNSD